MLIPFVWHTKEFFCFKEAIFSYRQDRTVVLLPCNNKERSSQCKQHLNNTPVNKDFIRSACSAFSKAVIVSPITFDIGETVQKRQRQREKVDALTS